MAESGDADSLEDDPPEQPPAKRSRMFYMKSSSDQHPVPAYTQSKQPAHWHPLPGITSTKCSFTEHEECMASHEYEERAELFTGKQSENGQLPCSPFQ